jgi:TM2 domain-containing membrane protein YozV
MILKKECACGQNLEFEQEDAPYINCPSCGRLVSDLFDPATAAALPRPLTENARYANVAGNAKEKEANAKGPASPPPMPRAKGLFVIVGDETKGPYSLKQVKAMYESGQLTMDTQCCREGDEKWRPLVELENEIFQSDRRQTPPLIPTTNVNVTMPPPQMVRVAKARWVYIVLGLFLGLLGVHNFYAGYNNRGAGQLVLTLLTGWLILPLFFIALWVLLEIASVNQDANGVPFV